MSEAERPKPQSIRPSVQSLLEDLRPILSAVTKASIRGVGVHGCALRASLAKSFEFAAFVHQNPSPGHGFFITPTLRGICEDLTVLTFVAPLRPDDRNEAVSLLMAKNIADGIAAQSAFSSRCVLGRQFFNRRWKHRQILKGDYAYLPKLSGGLGSRHGRQYGLWPKHRPWSHFTRTSMPPHQ